jgi:polyferredoxin
MIELFTLLSLTKNDDKKQQEAFQNYRRYPWNWVFMILIISFGTAYLAYSCNEKEIPSTRFLITLFSFFFSGIYLIYYFLIYIVFDKKCNGKDVSELLKKLK